MTLEDKKVFNLLLDHCVREAESEEFDSKCGEVWRERVRVLGQINIDNCSSRCETCHPTLPLKLEYATDNVPWVRQGYPGSVRTHEGEKPWSKEVVNTGACPERLITDGEILSGEFAFGVHERAFAYLWDYENNGKQGGSILHHIMRDERIRTLIRDERDRWLCMLIAQSIVQWFGTNCGRGFISTAEKIAERDTKRLKDEKNFLHNLRNCPSGNLRD